MMLHIRAENRQLKIVWRACAFARSAQNKKWRKNFLNRCKVRVEMGQNKPLVYGIIHIGSSTLSMRIVEYRGVNEIKVIEEVRKEVAFGEEVFLHKRLSFASIRRLCGMLNGLRQLLDDYRVDEYAVFATAVFRESKNRRLILDLVRANTGFNVRIIDMPQEIYYKHFTLQHRIREINRKRHYDLGVNFLFVDITSGCVGLTVWEQGALKYQQNVHVGTLRLLESFTLNQRDSQDFPQAMSEYIHSIMAPLWKAISLYHPRCLVLSGREARIMADLMKLDMDHHDMVELAPADFDHMYEEAGSLPPSIIEQKYKMPEQWAQAVLPTAHMYKEILDHVPVEKVIMMGTTFIDAAALFYGAEKTNDPELLYMRAQNIELTRSIAERYYYEPDHARMMEIYAHAILEALAKVTGLGEREEFLLRMAIILCQVGKYVNLLGRSQQACRIVKGIDIFGLSDKEKDIVACIVFYDHSKFPSDDDEPFRVLDERAKMVVLKLVAIFRVVRAMDISRKQKLQDVTARLAEEKLTIQYDSHDNTAIETWMFDKEKELFRNVFGLDAELVRR